MKIERDVTVGNVERFGMDEQAFQRISQEMQRRLLFDVLGHPQRPDLLL